MIENDPVAACLAGHLSPELAIAALLLTGHDPAAIRARVDAARAATPGWTALAGLVRDGTLERLQHMIDAAAVDHAEAATPETIAAMFDRAVAVSPEASVALYSLGDADRLHAATLEIVDWLGAAGLLGHDKDVLDLGCGIGRVAAALANEVRTVLGIDVSHAMMEQARRRCASLPNVSFAHTAGRDLAVLPNDACDLILAVDSFPYLVQAGVAEQHVADAARILRDGGSLVVLNLSYRANADADRADAERWARRFGLLLDPPGPPPFRSWDARAFRFRRG
jgi:ubiquinone/menaquinone biosynthesis C-methylase UbiE